MSTSTPSPYEYSSSQATVSRLYDIYRCTVLNKRYHASKLRRARCWTCCADALSAITATTAIGSLAIWKTILGQYVFGILVTASAIVSVGRASFRISESMDQTSRLSFAWNDLSLDIDGLLAAIREDGRLTDIRRQQIHDMFERFRRLETHDEQVGDTKLMTQLQADVDRAIPTERLWLPPE